MEHREIWNMMDIFIILIVVMVSQVYTIKLIQLYTLNMQIIVCQFCLNKNFFLTFLKPSLPQKIYG